MRKMSVGSITVGTKARKLINEALGSNRLSCGKLVHRFEKGFAEFNEIAKCVAVGTGTAADTLALAALHDFGVERRDEVIIPALTFVATANAVIHAGLTPVFVDVEKNTYNIDPSRIEAAITEKTKAIMPVHLFGRPCKMNEILEIAEKHGLFVVEDAAEAIGSKLNGKLVGTFGDMGAFSFYIAHLMTSVEGGAVITNKREYADTVRSLRAHGRMCVCEVCVINISPASCPLRLSEKEVPDKRFYFQRIGYSSKMSELHAAVGLEQLEMLPEIIRKRRENMKYITKGLEPLSSVLTLFEEGPGERIAPLCYPIVVKQGMKARELREFLESKGIETRPFFGSIPDQQPAYSFVKQKGFTNSINLSNNGFYVGVHQGLNKENLDYFVSTIKEYAKRFEK